MFDIGKRIRQLRIKNDLTLQELASRTELTKGFLSQLERNLTSPSIQTLEDIAEALGTTMSRFFTDDAEEKVVFTKDDVFVDEEEEYTVNWIVPNAQKNAMEPMILQLKSGGSSEEIAPNEGEEMGYVLNGRILLFNGSDKKGIPVKKGETFYMKSDRTHHLENHTGITASVLWISTPPEF